MEKKLTTEVERGDGMKDKSDRKRSFVVGGNVYKQEIMFCFNMTPQEAFKVLKRTYQGATKEDEEYVAGDKEFEKVATNATMYPLSKGFLILLKWPKNSFRENLCIVAHEITHTVHYIMRRVRIPLTEDTEEAYTYLFEDILRKFLHKLY